MKTCLIVDDSRVIRKISRQILETTGFICEEAENGQVALDYCRQNMPFCILLDWSMPVMDGMSFMLAMRALPGGDAPVVIFCTTENAPAQIQTALDAGANEYIMKPFDADIICGKLAQLGLVDQ